MQSALVAGGAFLFGFCATYAGMKSLLAFEQRRALRTANWGLLVNGLNWSAVILVVLTNNFPAILADLFGCYLADYLVVRYAKSDRLTSRSQKGHTDEVQDSAALHRGDR